MTLLTTTASRRLTLSRSALAHNLQLLQTRGEVLAMVKGNGYGTGSDLLAKTLSELGVGHFGVATVGEGIALREGGIAGEILVCYCAPHESASALEHDLQPAVWSERGIDALAQCKIAGSVHLHINTGMNRLGCKPAEAAQLAKQIERAPNLTLRGVMTHLASADAPLRDQETQQALADFRACLQQVSAPLIHAFNSAATLRFSLPESNLVRIGLALFGLYGSEATRDILPLKCALKLTSQIIHIQHCRPGERVSYGGHYVVKRESRIGVVPLGYYDGIHLVHSGQSVLHICGKPAPIVGTICMDYLMCDLTDIPEAHIDTEVVVFDENVRPETFAASANRSVYELITCLGPRIERKLA